MTDEHLWNYLRSTIPPDASPIVEAAICAIGRLPGVGTWKPNTLHWYETMKVVTWGIPFTFTEGITSLNKLRKKIGTSIADKGEPDPTDLAEVDVAALLAMSKAQWVARVPEGKARTPDFHARWDTDQIVEIEVTRANRKPAHIEREKFADRICEQIYALHYPWDVVIYISDMLNDEEVQSLLEAVHVMKPGNCSERSGRWWLYVEIPKRLPGEYNLELYSRPLRGWPPETVAGGFIMRFYPDNPSSTTPNPLVYIGYGVPVAGYINPVEHKATWSQGSKSNPFVVAVDVDCLPNRFVEFQRVLPVYLEGWPSVSAVLLFQRERHKNKFGWTWELHSNPQAQYPLPSAMLRHFTTAGDTSSKYWNYTTGDLV